MSTFLFIHPDIKNVLYIASNNLLLLHQKMLAKWNTGSVLQTRTDKLRSILSTYAWACLDKNIKSLWSIHLKGKGKEEEKKPVCDDNARAFPGPHGSRGFICYTCIRKVRKIDWLVSRGRDKQKVERWGYNRAHFTDNLLSGSLQEITTSPKRP